tara:strand:- start:1091 stop:1804 length:714 start_codon:yes stop_codon:yes gene_type:complete
MSKSEPVKVVSENTPDARLSGAFQALKAEKPMPEALKRRILDQAKQSAKARNWRSWWYFSQFALGCAALILVLSWHNPASLPAYYQIDTIDGLAETNGESARVQWHHLTASASAKDDASIDPRNLQTLRLKTLKAQQHKLQQSGELSAEMQSQVGLLTRHQDSWQIAMCDKLQLNLAIELVQELNTTVQITPLQQPQWVELQFAPTGHILAIATLPTNKSTRQCLSVQQQAVVQQQS